MNSSRPVSTLLFALVLLLLLGLTGAAMGSSPILAQVEVGISLIDLNPEGDSSPMHMTDLGGYIIFSADDGEHGRELWISGGSRRTTRMIKDIHPGPEGSNPIPGGELEFNPVPEDARTSYALIGDTVYFVADDGEHGREVWLSDGTEAGTRMLADITEGDEEWGVASFLTEHDGRLFFMADNAFDGEELWVSDGSEAGTNQVADIMDGPAGSLPSHLTSTSFGLAFAAEDFDHGVEAWLSDGTADGTIMLGDIAEGLDGSDPHSFQEYEGKILFAASDEFDGTNYETWISDGSPDGTEMLLELNPNGPGFSIGYTLHNGLLYFGGNDGQGGTEIWITDATANGTRPLANIASGRRGADPSTFFSYGELLFFQAFHFAYGLEPWVSDGTEEGTRLVLDLNPGNVPSSRPAEPQQLGDWLYFSAERSGSGRELWRSDGSSAGTSIVEDIRSGNAGSDPTGLLAAQGKLYFAAADSKAGRELRVLGGLGGAVPTLPVPTDSGPATEVPATETPTDPAPTIGPPPTESPAIYLPMLLDRYPDPAG